MDNMRGSNIVARGGGDFGGANAGGGLHNNNNAMSRRRNPLPIIDETVGICCMNRLKQLLDDVNQTECTFPPTLTSEERKWLHNIAPTYGLKTKSYGAGPNRSITVFKKSENNPQTDSSYDLTRFSRQQVLSLTAKVFFGVREVNELKEGQNATHLSKDGKVMPVSHIGKIMSVKPQVPPPAPYMKGFVTEAQRVRESLPIWNYRGQIMEAINSNQIVLIRGDTGCGKTTQVPQFILECSTFNQNPCRILCAEPRRLAALSVADRVASERMEQLGTIVGYQIRLESSISPMTLLTFCTSGVLLRNLMTNENTLKNVTHVIIDEIHERDRFHDFLALILRDFCAKYNHLKLILMSATLNADRWVNYFGNCPVIDIPGTCFQVKPFFLESILSFTEYSTAAMRSYIASIQSRSSRVQSLIRWCNDAAAAPATGIGIRGVQMLDDEISPAVSPLLADMLKVRHDGQGDGNFQHSQSHLQGDLLPHIRDVVESALQQLWIEGSDVAFRRYLKLIAEHDVSVDYQHSATGVTALIAATCRGNINAVETLLSMGANISISTPNPFGIDESQWDALRWAKHFDQQDVVDLLEAHQSCIAKAVRKDPLAAESLAALNFEMTEDERRMLEAYQNTFNDEEVDLDLIFTLVCTLCRVESQIYPNEPKGAILIFLPGYDEIVNLRDRIMRDSARLSEKFQLYTLHSQMQRTDQKRVFQSVPQDTRKIILSTNIAETSITIDDIVYVIDSGKVKEQSYDPNLGVSSLKTVWISQSSAIQRRGRAGRCKPGVCYHLFSKTRFLNMEPFQVPEILRTPIHELCLQAKILAADSTSIAEFLSKAPDPPSIEGIKHSVKLLKTIGALSADETLTHLGLHLLDMPLEPILGKIVLYGIVLKCLDPILTIVCSLAYRDPFLIPWQPSKKCQSVQAKKMLSCNTYSDHMTLLRAFQYWQKSQRDGLEKQTCDAYFISSSTMEMIAGMRAQLVGQLRAAGFVKFRGAGDIRDVNVNSENWAVIKAALCAGSYPNLLYVDRKRKKIVSRKENNVRFHPSSVLNSPLVEEPKTNIFKNRAKFISELPCDWFLYEEMTRVGRAAYAKTCTLLTPMTVALFAGGLGLADEALAENKPQGPLFDSDDDCDDLSIDSDYDASLEKKTTALKIDDWIKFRLEPDVARMTLELRKRFSYVVLKRVSSPSKPLAAYEEETLTAMINVLSAEEQAYRLYQPTGIGQKPRPVDMSFSLPLVSNVAAASPPGVNQPPSSSSTASTSSASSKNPHSNNHTSKFSGHSVVHSGQMGGRSHQLSSRK